MKPRSGDFLDDICGRAVVGKDGFFETGA